MDKLRVNDLSNLLSESDLNSQSYLINQDFYSVFGGDWCKNALPLAEKVSLESVRVGRLLSSYESKKFYNEDEYNYLKRKYFLLELNAFILFTKMNQNCKTKNHMILFFYDIDQGSSIAQGTNLDELVEENKLVYVFSFDRTYTQEPLLESIKTQYNITKSPTLIINSNKKLEGFTTYKEILNSLN